jgi:hypothetical protein
MNKDADIRFECLCGQSLEAPGDMEGVEVECPACQKMLIIPGIPKARAAQQTDSTYMSRKLCKHCGGQVDFTAFFCKHCHQQIANFPTKEPLVDPSKSQSKPKAIKTKPKAIKNPMCCPKCGHRQGIAAVGPCPQCCRADCITRVNSDYRDKVEIRCTRCDLEFYGVECERCGHTINHPYLGSGSLNNRQNFILMLTIIGTVILVFIFAIFIIYGW